jgi:hypothetical protein
MKYLNRYRQAVVFSLAHYAFYMFARESENQTTIDFP